MPTISGVGDCVLHQSCKVRIHRNCAFKLCAYVRLKGFNKYYPPDYDDEKHKSLNAYRGMSVVLVYNRGIDAVN